MFKVKGLCSGGLSPIKLVREIRQIKDLKEINGSRSLFLGQEEVRSGGGRFLNSAGQDCVKIGRNVWGTQAEAGLCF